MFKAHKVFLFTQPLALFMTKYGLLVVMFFRFVTSSEIQKRSEFFEPFIMGLTNATVEQVCSTKKQIVNICHLLMKYFVIVASD